MRTSPRRLTILDLMLLIAGLGLGLWLGLGAANGDLPRESEARWLFYLTYVLGGLSLIGPPLLLRERLRRGSRLRLGEMFWFCQGTASWLLWPPVVVHRVRAGGDGGTMSAVCFFYGTPLMALYVMITLLAGGWLRPRRRRRSARRRPWTETFGLLLGLVWACTGLYVLSMIYRDDFGR